MRYAVALPLLLLAACSSAPRPAAQPIPAPTNSTPAAQAPPASSISAKTAGLTKRDGFIPLYLDERTGKLLLELPRDSTRALYFLSQATGLGSNPVGIDR